MTIKLWAESKKAEFNIILAILMMRIIDRMTPKRWKGRSIDKTFEEEFSKRSRDSFYEIATTRMAKAVIGNISTSVHGEMNMKTYFAISLALGDIMGLNLSSLERQKNVTKNQLIESEKKASFILATMLLSGLDRCNNSISSDSIDIFIGRALDVNKDIFTRLYTRSIHYRLKKSGKKISNEKFSNKDLEVEISRITDILTGIYDEDKTSSVNPQLSAEALRMIASSYSAVSDIDDSIDVYREAEKTFKNSKDGNEKVINVSASSSAFANTKTLKNRMNRLYQIGETLADETKRFIEEMSIGNVEEVGSSVMMKTSECMAERISDLINERE